MKIVNLELLLPEDIPEGERILWYGRPDFVSLARHAFRGDLVALYFGVMASWHFASGTYDAGLSAGALDAARTLAVGMIAISLVAFLGWLSARTTLYVVTSKRLVMKVGMALPVFFNIPFTQIANASLRTYRDETGDITFALTAGQRIAYFHLWPHARPFQFSKPEPAMRCVADGVRIARIVADALADAVPGEKTAPASTHAGSVAPSTNGSCAPAGVLTAA